MSKREENKAQMEQMLYETALDMFCEMGYQKTTLMDIASEANVSTRTLHNYFPTKESILRKFGKENIVALKVFARELPNDMDLKDKVLEVYVTDFKNMFMLFDISYILHSARDDKGVYSRFEQENILRTESIYNYLFRQEQLRLGHKPSDVTALCASVVMGVYRHCSDTYRFRAKKGFDEDNLRSFFRAHLDAIWPGLYQTVTSEPSENFKKINEARTLFVRE